jgi:hypothetical protein
MDNEFVMIVDDWTGIVEGHGHATTKDATLEGLKQSGLNVLKSWELGPKTPVSDPNGFWNGLGVFILSK